MPSSIEFSGIVQNGHLPAPVRTQIANTMQRMEGKRLAIKISEAKRRRSNSQNAYYWGVVIEQVRQLFADSGTDIDKEECHDFLKQHVGGLKDVVCDPSGARHSILKSSTKLTTRDWEDYMEKIRAWAAQFGCQIPFPNEDGA